LLLGLKVEVHSLQLKNDSTAWSFRIVLASFRFHFVVFLSSSKYETLSIVFECYFVMFSWIPNKNIWFLNNFLVHDPNELLVLALKRENTGNSIQHCLLLGLKACFDTSALVVLAHSSIGGQSIHYRRHGKKLAYSSLFLSRRTSHFTKTEKLRYLYIYRYILQSHLFMHLLVER
jgi:hypothetical protein